MKHKTIFLILTILLTLSAYFLGKHSASENRTNILSLSEIYSAPDLPIVKIGDKTITESELTHPVQVEYHNLKKQLYDFQMDLVQQYVVDNFLRTEAEKKNQDFNTYVDELVKGKITVSEKELQEWIETNHIPADELKKDPSLQGQLKQMIYQDKEEAYLKNYVQEQMGQTPVSLYISKPHLTVGLALESLVGSPQWGEDQAPVTITYFGDFECPYCKQFNATLDAMKKKYPKGIKIFWKQLPSPSHTGAMDLAHASLCANEQSQFWNFYSYAFQELNLKTGVEIILSYPKSNRKIKENQFQKCMIEQKYKKNIETDLNLARFLGIQGTPFIVVNGEGIVGAVKSEEFERIILKHLKD